MLSNKARAAETMTEDGDNFLTHIELQEAMGFDGEVVKEVISELQDKKIEPYRNFLASARRNIPR